MATDNHITGTRIGTRALQRAMTIALAALALHVLGGASTASAGTVYVGKIDVDNGAGADDIRFTPPEKVLFVPPGGTGVRFRADYRLHERKVWEYFTAARVRIEREVGDFGSGQWEAIWSDRRTYSKNANNVQGSFLSDVIEQTRPVVRYRIHLRGKFGDTYRHCLRTREVLYRPDKCESSKHDTINSDLLPIAVVVMPPRLGGRGLAATLVTSHLAALAYREYQDLFFAIAGNKPKFDLHSIKRRMERRALAFVAGSNYFLAETPGDVAEQLAEDLLDDLMYAGGAFVSATFMLVDYVEKTKAIIDQVTNEMREFFTQSCYVESMNAVRNARILYSSADPNTPNANNTRGYETAQRATSTIISALERYGYDATTSLQDVLTDLSGAQDGLVDVTRQLDAARQRFWEAGVSVQDGQAYLMCNPPMTLRGLQHKGWDTMRVHQEAVRLANKFFDKQQLVAARQVLSVAALRQLIGDLRTLEVIARNDRPAPVKLQARGYDAKGGTTFDTILTWAADDNRFSAQGIEAPARTSRLILTYINDTVTGSGEDGDRNALIDYVDWAGIRIEGEKYEHETGCTVKGDRNASRGNVAYCPLNGNAVSYRLPTPPPVEPDAPPREDWISESDDLRDLAVTALNDTSGSVRVQAQGFDDQGVRTFDVTLEWPGNAAGYSTETRQVPARTRRLALSLLDGMNTTGGAHGLSFDFLEWSGLHIEAENYEHRNGCNKRWTEEASAEYVTDCDLRNDSVTYRLPAPPVVGPIEPPREDWIAESDDLRDLAVTALNDTSGSVRVQAQGFDDQGVRLFDVTLEWPGNTAGYSTETRQVPAQTRILALSLLDGMNTAGGTYGLSFDFLEWSGLHIEAENYEHRNGCNKRWTEEASAEYVTDCDLRNDSVTYRLPAPPEPPPAQAEQPPATGQLRVVTLNDKPGPVTLKAQGFDDKGKVILNATLSWVANDNSYSAKDLDLPGTTRRIRLTFTNDYYTPGGPDTDRNAFIDYLEWGGRRIEAEDFNRTGGLGGDPGCGSRLHSDTFGSRVADCGNRGDYVEYDLR